MAEYQAGSVEAFDRLHDALAADLRTYLTMLARDAARADDLVQETFLQMHRARAAHIPGEPLRPWVFAIAKRVFLMHRRGALRREHREWLSVVANPSPSYESIETERLHARQQVEAALRGVSSGGRRAFLLHHLFGFSFKEIGAKLGIQPTAAKIRSSRAVSAMRALLKEGRDD